MKNIILAIFCAAFAMGAYAMTTTFPSPPQEYRSPSVYPRAVIGAIIVLSIVVLIAEFMRKRAPETAEEPSSVKVPIQVLALMAAYFVLMQFIGFFVSTFAFLIVMFLFFGGRIRSALLFAAGMTTGQYVLFVLLLDVRIYDPVMTFIRHAF